MRIKCKQKNSIWINLIICLYCKLSQNIKVKGTSNVNSSTVINNPSSVVTDLRWRNIIISLYLSLIKMWDKFYQFLLAVWLCFIEIWGLSFLQSYSHLNDYMTIKNTFQLTRLVVCITSLHQHLSTIVGVTCLHSYSMSYVVTPNVVLFTKTSCWYLRWYFFFLPSMDLLWALVSHIWK